MPRCVARIWCEYGNVSKTAFTVSTFFCCGYKDVTGGLIEYWLSEYVIYILTKTILLLCWQLVWAYSAWCTQRRVILCDGLPATVCIDTHSFWRVSLLYSACPPLFFPAYLLSLFQHSFYYNESYFGHACAHDICNVCCDEWHPDMGHEWLWLWICTLSERHFSTVSLSFTLFNATVHCSTAVQSLIFAHHSCVRICRELCSDEWYSNSGHTSLCSRTHCVPWAFLLQARISTFCSLAFSILILFFISPAWNSSSVSNHKQRWESTHKACCTWTQTHMTDIYGFFTANVLCMYSRRSQTCPCVTLSVSVSWRRYKTLKNKVWTHISMGAPLLEALWPLYAVNAPIGKIVVKTAFKSRMDLKYSW